LSFLSCSYTTPGCVPLQPNNLLLACVRPRLFWLRAVKSSSGPEHLTNQAAAKAHFLAALNKMHWTHLQEGTH